MKAVIADFEVSPFRLTLETYDLRVKVQRFNHEDITREWNLLSAAWKVLGEDKTHVIAVSPKSVHDDEKIVRKMHQVLGSADILIGHNWDAFDIKKFNTRAIIHGLPPLPPVQTVDTLKIARSQFKFTSNKLAYIAQILKVGAKDESPDWKKVMAGDRAEIARMKAYNITDVDVTEKVYLKLRAFAKTRPNMNILAPVSDIAGERMPICPTCGSPDIVKNGKRYSTTGIRQRFSCRSCGAYSFMDTRGNMK